MSKSVMWVVKARNITIIGILLLCIFGIMVGAGVSNSVSVSKLSDFSVVIDAGHGGVDVGAVGAYEKTKESELNLNVAKSLQSRLLASGINVVMTRNDSNGLYGMATKGFKKRDMEKRKKIIENSKANLVVSIHMNTCQSSSRRGAQVFYAKKSEEGKLLANSLQSKLNTLWQKNYISLEGDYFILNCSSVPSVIVECGFLSNAHDEKILKTKEFQEKVSLCISEGVVEYLLKNASYQEYMRQGV